MEYKLEIRRATIGDAQNISELICELSIIYICHEFTKEGADALLASMSPDAIRKYIEAGYQYHVAEISNRLIGVSGVKDNSHLYHLFVAEKYHRQGIARKLWQVSMESCISNRNPGEFTVNASIYALGAYEKLGFVAQSGPEEKHGVSYIPMRQTINDTEIWSIDDD